MTASERLREWVASILGGEFVVNAEPLPSERNFQSAMIRANPGDSETAFVDGRRRFVKYKTLCLRLGLAGDDAPLENEALLAEFQEIVRGKSRRRELPPDDGRAWKSVECPGSPLPVHIDESGATAVYQLTLRIIYEED
jgi:hypothetical protein